MCSWDFSFYPDPAFAIARVRPCYMADGHSRRRPRDRPLCILKKNRALRIELSEVSERSIRQSETLSEAETRLSQISAVLDAIPMPVWWRDESLRLLGCNRAYSESLETDTETILAEARELGAGAIDDKGQGLAAQAQQMGIPLSESHYVVHRGERRLLYRNSVKGPGRVRRRPCHRRDSDGERSIGTLVAHHYAKTFLESLATAIAIFGPDRRLRFYNRAFVVLWHFKASGLDTEPQIGELLELLLEESAVAGARRFSCLQAGARPIVRLGDLAP